LAKANELAENSIFSTNQGSGHNPAFDSNTRHSIMTGQETVLANQTSRNFKAGHSLVVPTQRKLLQTTNSAWQQTKSPAPVVYESPDVTSKMQSMLQKQKYMTQKDQELERQRQLMAQPSKQ